MQRHARTVLAALVAAIVLIVAVDPGASRPTRHAVPDRSRRVQRGVASFYGGRAAGKTTASGAPLRPNRMTAASPTLPLGTKARVTNKDSGKSAQVTITDRGPFAKGRILDVTPKAARQLGIDKKDGVAAVSVKPISEPPAPH